MISIDFQVNVTGEAGTNPTPEPAQLPVAFPAGTNHVISGLGSVRIPFSVTNIASRIVTLNEITVATAGISAAKISVDLSSTIMTILPGEAYENSIIVETREPFGAGDSVTIKVQGKESS
jgi:hypothetical protein